MSKSKQSELARKEDIEMNLSPVQRDKLKKKLRMEEKERMRKSLPVLNMNEIRRYRLPYETALIMELEERGYRSSAAFLQQILKYHAVLCAEHGPDSLVSSRPKLQKTPGHLDVLYHGLIKAEAAHYDGKIAKEIDELLRLSIFFGLGSDDWWWLGEQLLIQSVNVSTNYQGDGSELEATSRFIFGKFLIENLKDAERAIEQLDIARYLSLGKHWTAFRILKQKQKSIFMETCGLLSGCYLKLVYGQFHQNIDVASKLCIKAITRGQEACDYKKVAEANLMKGRCDMNTSRYTDAITSFQKSLALYQRMKMIDEACEARIQLALALLTCGKFVDSAYHLRKLLEYANDNDQTTYMARAYRYLGEYYLNHGSPQIATPILLLSMRMFHRLNDIFNREQLKNLAAISQGQEALPYYLKLVSTADGTPHTSGMLQKLLSWKEIRKPFWPKDLGSHNEHQERYLKYDLGTGISETESNEAICENIEYIVSGDKEFMDMTEGIIRRPRVNTMSICRDGPIQIIRDEDILLETLDNANTILERLSVNAEADNEDISLSEKVCILDEKVEKSGISRNESIVSKFTENHHTEF